MRRRFQGRGVLLTLACIPIVGITGCGSSDAMGLAVPPGEMQPPGSILLLRGSFHDVVTPGTGRAEIFEAPDGTRTLHLSDFRTDPGPKLEVYMVAAPDATDSQSVVDAGYISLGALQSASGDQTYSVPADLDLSVYRAVTIWCVTFVVNFTTAPVTPVVSA